MTAETHALSTPGQIMARLEELERDLAERMGEFEEAALAWYRVKRDREKNLAEAYLSCGGTVGERKAYAEMEHGLQGAEEEGRYEGLKAVIRVMETRGAIGMALLKAHGRS